jgi:hypothetical protein
MKPSSSEGRKLNPAAIVLSAVAVAMVMALFAWPTARLEPRDLPIGVVGTDAATDPLVGQLSARGDDAFDIERYPDEGAARSAIEARDVYGAFVPTPAGPKVLTASAASATVAQRLTHAADAAAGPGKRAEVVDVVPAPPEGSGLPSSVFPLILVGSITGALVMSLGSGAFSRLGLTVAGASLAGLAGALVMHTWLDIVGGDWLATAGVIGLTIGAIAATVAGLQSLFGRTGGMVGALTMVLIGNPFSGVGSAPELLPRPVGELGQLLPPGAGGNLLRSTGYFDGAGGSGHLLVLSAWALFGIGALLASAVVARRRLPALAPAPA